MIAKSSAAPKGVRHVMATRGATMSRILLLLTLSFLPMMAAPVLAVEKEVVKKNVDDMVAAIDGGREATSFAADTHTPYVFIMEPGGRLIVHPYLAGEYLQEKAAPVFKALQRATAEGVWVTYFWKGAEKETYVRRTRNNLTVGSGN